VNTFAFVCFCAAFALGVAVIIAAIFWPDNRT
jgi:hypothetical protein